MVEASGVTALLRSVRDRGGLLRTATDLSVGVSKTVLGRSVVKDGTHAVCPFDVRPLVAELISPALGRSFPISENHDLSQHWVPLRLVEVAGHNMRRIDRSAKLRRQGVEGVGHLPAVSDAVGDVCCEHVDISLAGHCDCGPPQRLRVGWFTWPVDVVRRQLPATCDEALVRQGQGGVAASIVVNNANLLEVAGPVIGKVSLQFLQGDDVRYYRFDLRLRSRRRQT